MGKISSQPIPVKKHSKFIDVSTPHENKDIAKKTLTSYNIQPSIFKIRVPILFIERDTGELDGGSAGNKYWGEVKFRILASFLSTAKFYASIYTTSSDLIIDTYIYNHNNSKKVALIRKSQGAWETNISIIDLSDDDILQVGVDVHQPVSGAKFKVDAAYAELTYESEGES